MNAIPQRGPLLAPGDEPPGRWIDDGKHNGLRTWQGSSEWRTQHGPAAAQWSLGRVNYIWNASLPDGSRANVASTWPALETFRRSVNDSYEHGTIDVRPDDVIFTPIAGADLPKLEVKDEERGLFDLLVRDEAFMLDIRDAAMARALCSVLENASVTCGSERFDFGQRSAGHFIAALRDNGEIYLDFAWSGGTEIADLETIRAHFRRLGIFAVLDAHVLKAPLNIDEQARALLKEVMTPKRRARLRLAEPLRNAQQVEIETPAGKIAAWRLGEGPAVLLVHGWQDDNSLWSPLISALADIGVASVAFDLPGHGFSQGDQCTPTLAAAALGNIAAQLGPIDAVVTHSFGGPVTGFALLNGFTPRRIVLIAPPRGRNKRWFDFAEERGIPQDVVQRARELFAAEAGLRATFDLAAVASPIETLVLHSMDDDAVEWENAKAIAEGWPNAELALCDGLGHRMIAQDRGVIERIVTFVA